MSIPPGIVTTARKGWNWQWNQLMNALAPCDEQGNYVRKPSHALKATIPNKQDLLQRSKNELPLLIIGRSCPWAHRTWLIYELKNLSSSLNLLIAEADHKAGNWKINPAWKGCNSLLEIYKLCNSPPEHRATVPALIDPKGIPNSQPKLLGNESAQLVEVLNEWPSEDKNFEDLNPQNLHKEINNWQELIQFSINNGVYKCGFARNQTAYNNASEDLFKAMKILNEHLSRKGPWLCGNKITIADIRLFPTIIRWESVYAPLFGCSEKSLQAFPKILEWRKRFFNIPKVSKTCNSHNWLNDYYGALFPLNASNIIPRGPDLQEIINYK
ncbi:glutathione S-transferase family protein [Prochlorococcus marinus]|uniref:glutathione S-transferase family protein n=1 Tax=Prochlorococcus marinus TaxID=1219 RepID=UPI0022B5298E|nr:glutathione S-transferase family protein [Prochlorococcus marinus]